MMQLIFPICSNYFWVVFIIIIQDGGLLPGDEDELESQKLLDEIDRLRNELILEQQKKSILSEEDLQGKEKQYQETKARANKAEQEVEAQKVITRLDENWTTGKYIRPLKS